MRPGTGILMAALAMASLPVNAAPVLKIKRGMYDDDLWAKTPEPYDAGRRAEKDAIALAKAEAKRQRKAAKRRAEVGAGGTADKRPNVEFRRGEALACNAGLGAERPGKD